MLTREPSHPTDHRSDQRGYVYFFLAHDGERVKIGHSATPHKRIKQMGGDKLDFIAAVPGTVEQEQALHGYFKAFQVEGTREHFWLRGELQTYVAWVARQTWAGTVNTVEALKAARAPEAWLPWMLPQPREYDDQLLLPFRGWEWGKLPPSNTSDEYYTRPGELEAVRAVLGTIELDPASHVEANRNVKAEQFYTINDDALTIAWEAKTVFLNPPYSLAGPFAQKLVNHYDAGHIKAAVALLSNRAASSRWFVPLWDHLLCFPAFRLQFNGPDGAGESAHFGHVFVYLGPDRPRFAEVFSTYGAVVERYAGAKGAP